MGRVLACIAIVMACACTETVELGSGRLSGLVSIEIRPPAAIATVTDLGAGPVVVEFKAVGRFVDGTRRDITKLVEWSVDNPAPGAILDGTYLTSNAAGGRALVRARALVGDSVIESDADIHVIIALELVDGVFPPPVGAEALFGPDMETIVGGPRAPALLYPANETLFPQDLSRIVFQHAPAAGTDAFRWRLVSESLSLSFLTGGSRWQPDGGVWSLIAATHPGGEVKMTIEAVDSTQPGTIYSSPEERMLFARGGGGGVIYHWSNSTNAIMRSTLSNESAQQLYPTGSDMSCVACHAVSRDGKQMALGYDGELLRTIDIETQSPILNAPLRPMGWATFSPDGKLVLVADLGTLTLRDAKTGATVGPNMGRITLPATYKATHPDWSPDGRFVVFALSTDIPTNMTIGSGAIARIPYNGGAWGATQVLVAGLATSNNYFPKYSPDGRFIAFVRAPSASQGAPFAELRVMPADGGSSISLDRANHRVGAIDGFADLANTMPSWGPDIDEDQAWIAFASARPYGGILPNRGTTQIWITGVDLAKAAQGVDPSSAAFWLTSQSVGVPNNNPIWAPHVQPTN